MPHATTVRQCACVYRQSLCMHSHYSCLSCHLQVSLFVSTYYLRVGMIACMRSHEQVSTGNVWGGPRMHIGVENTREYGPAFVYIRRDTWSSDVKYIIGASATHVLREASATHVLRVAASGERHRVMGETCAPWWYSCIMASSNSARQSAACKCLQNPNSHSKSCAQSR
jgi:hypothetical protein